MQLTSVCTTLNIYCSQVEARCCEKTKKDSGADRPQRVLCFGVFAFRNVERCIGISGLQDRFPACLMWRLCQRRTGRIIPAGWSSGLFDTPVDCYLGLAYSNAHISLTAKRGLLLVWKEERIFTFAYLQVTGAEKTMGSGLSSS